LNYAQPTAARTKGWVEYVFRGATRLDGAPVSYGQRMASRRELVADRAHQALKQAQRRMLAADHAAVRLYRQLSLSDPVGPYTQHTFAVEPDRASLRSVLVFKPDELGDAVYAMPALAELRRTLPDVRISLVCRPFTAPLYERAGLVDEIATYEPGPRFGPYRRRLRASLESLSADSFDLGIFLRTYTTTFREFLTVPCRARVHPLDPRLRSDSPYRVYIGGLGDHAKHQALQLLELVSPVTGRTYALDDVVFPELTWSPGESEAVDRLVSRPAGRPLVVLHPFAKHETRRYPLDYWPELLASLRERLEADWVVVGGPEDGQAPWLEGTIQLQGRLKLLETAYLLSTATAFIGNLSGPAHLAAALGTPTLTLMSGHSLPTEWAPLGRSHVIRADVPCAPCHQKTCPVYDLACLRALSPRRVVDEVADFLTRAETGAEVTAPPRG